MSQVRYITFWFYFIFMNRTYKTARACIRPMTSGILPVNLFPCSDLQEKYKTKFSNRIFIHKIKLRLKCFSILTEQRLEENRCCMESLQLSDYKICPCKIEKDISPQYSSMLELKCLYKKQTHTGSQSLCSFQCSPGQFQLDYCLSHHLINKITPVKTQT